jgi:hypothetical protein
MMHGIAFGWPGNSEEGRSVHLPCGHDAVVPSDGSVMMLPSAVLDHLDHCPGEVPAPIEPATEPR